MQVFISTLAFQKVITSNPPPPWWKLRSADGDANIAGVVYFGPLSGEQAIFDFSVVTVGSDNSLARTSRAELDGVMALLRARNAVIAPFRK